MWVLDPKNKWLQLRGETDGQCIDLDMSDHNLEMYHCNPSVISHQQFSYDNTTGSFTVLVDNSCMTVVDPNVTATTGQLFGSSTAVEVQAIDVQIAAAKAELEALQDRRRRLGH